MTIVRYERRKVLSAIGGMIGLAVVGAALGAENTFDGVYTGKRVLAKDTGGPGCPAAEEVSVIIQGKMLSFTNSELKNFVVAFNPHQDGSFLEIYVDPFDDDTVTVEGRIAGGFLDADVLIPRASITGISRRADPDGVLS
jgi:hypothetical protein